MVLEQYSTLEVTFLGLVDGAGETSAIAVVKRERDLHSTVGLSYCYVEVIAHNYCRNFTAFDISPFA
jgi:hypothetical protein